MRFFALVLGLCNLFAAGARADQTLASKEVKFFETRIRPVLVEHCYECHAASSKSVKGGLRLDTRDGIRQGGESGVAVVPGEVEQGTLLAALRHETFEMPPSGQLPQRVIADFAAWIRRGAPDPRSGDAAQAAAKIDLERGRHFWSFQPIRKAQVPHPQDEAWSRTDIDRFVLARLEQAHLHPAADADRRTLLRRLYFDLIGLPPTERQSERFLQDKSPRALEQVVDQLLESPQFGERWGRHWLDVVRFAESTGGGRTRVLYDAWRYRDYVIHSLNCDKPFDQFVTEQIAGDLLSFKTPQQRAEQLTATGFLALGPTNYELQDKVLLEMEVIDEQLETIGRSMLAMSVGCARCHDHKFDPIPATDYYALAGIFRSTKTLIHANVSSFVERPLPVSVQRQAELDEHSQMLQTLQQEVAELDAKLEALNAKLGNAPLDLDELPGIIIDDRQAEVVGTWQASAAVKGFVGKSYLYTAAATGARRVIFAPDIPTAGEYEVRVSYTPHANRSGDAPITIQHAAGEVTICVDQRRPPPIGNVFLSLGRYPFDAGRGGFVAISDNSTGGNVIADAVQFLAVDQLERQTDAQRLTAAEHTLLAAAVAEATSSKRQLSTRLTRLRKNAPLPAPQVMSVEEAEQIVDCPLHVRGNVRNLGEAVPRGVLRVATIGPAPQFPADASGRLQLAQWIASPSNPLTARVIVNRVWHHLFGSGLVRTPDNFGSTGESPSHPQLLDHLATRLIEDRWSLKGMVKRIVLSRVYQLSSTCSEAGSQVDPENRLLGRAPRRRLDAEALRDAILAVSGQLDRTVGGSLIQPTVKSEFGYRFQSVRRSVYVPVFRNTLHDLFEVFDVANPNLVTGNRNTSTLATQALYLMNSPFVMDQARLAAEQLLSMPDLGTPGRIRRAYLQSLGRPPSRAEFELAAGYFDIIDGRNRPRPQQLDHWAGFYQTLFGCIDFRYVK